MLDVVSSKKVFTAAQFQKAGQKIIGKIIKRGKVPAARRWDEVTLIGTDGKAEVMAQDLADLIDSIPYEIVCSIHSRIPRIYKGF